jgi:hypothetical protein
MNKKNVASKKRSSREDDSEGLKNTDYRKVHQGKKVVRFYHNRQGMKCHAWDILQEYYTLWRQGEIALRAEWGILPNGDQPGVGMRVRCGTCEQTGFTLGEMTTEVVTL